MVSVLSKTDMKNKLDCFRWLQSSCVMLHLLNLLAVLVDDFVPPFDFPHAFFSINSLALCYIIN